MILFPRRRLDRVLLTLVDMASNGLAMISANADDSASLVDKLPGALSDANSVPADVVVVAGAPNILPCKY